MKLRLKDYLSVLAKPPLSALTIVSSLAWALLLWQHHQELSNQVDVILPIADNHLNLLKKFFNESAIVASRNWLIMLVAMMSPLLAESINYIWLRSLARKRTIIVTVYLTSYIAVWMIAGFSLIIGSAWMKLVCHDWWFNAFFLTSTLAILWQLSPMKEFCLNQCNYTPRISIFGLKALYDCCRYGFISGLWCIGSCWHLMLLPLSADRGQLLLMAFGQILIVYERYLLATKKTTTLIS